MIKKIFLLLLISALQVIPQNLDSLYNELLRLKQPGNLEGPESQVISKPNKCGFGTVVFVKQHFNEYSIEQQKIIQSVLERPQLQKNIISPSGIFRIHYDTTGRNVPAYLPEESVELNVNLLAAVFDSSYNFEVNILGYLPPPSDGTNGGDNKYDIYIRDMSGGDYAFTNPDSSLGNNKYTSYIEIDNDFSETEGYYTIGIDAAKATAAHEFHHAIQMGSYILNFDDRYYHELTSQAMEEAVFDEVNDYYYWMRTFFNTTEKSFLKHTGYDLAIWNIYLRQKYGGKAPNTGDKIVLRSWELMATPYGNRAIVAIAQALSEYGYSFKEELKDFSTWIYFTNNHAKQGKYFEEAADYPKLKIHYSYDFTAPTQILTLRNIEPISIRFIRFIDNSQGLPDTIYSIVSDSDVQTASTNLENTNEVEYTLSINAFEGARKINERYFSKFSGISLGNISEANIINNELAEQSTKRENLSFVYPQPFRYNKNVVLYIPTFADVSGKADLNVYSSDMNLVYSARKSILRGDKIAVTWDALDNNGNKLASGVYIYVTKAGDKVKKGKIVILN